MKTKTTCENSMKHGIFSKNQNFRFKLSVGNFITTTLVSVLLYSSIFAALFICIWTFGGCVSVAPVNSSFESAKTLGKGNAELAGNYSSYSVRGENYEGEKESAKINNNFGFRIGYGVGEKVDLKFRYERLIPIDKESKDEVSGVNYIAFTPKFAIYKNYIAGFTDVGMYSYRANDGSYSDKVFFVSPRMAFTYPSGKYFDLTFSPKLDYYFSEGTSFDWGVNLGCGLSSNLDKWAIRPEIGIMKSFEDKTVSYVTGGVALIVQIHSRKSAIIP